MKILNFVSIVLSALSIVAIFIGWFFFIAFLDSPKINTTLALWGSVAVGLLAIALPIYVIKTLIWPGASVTEHFKTIIMYLGLAYPFIGVGIIALLIFLDK